MPAILKEVIVTDFEIRGDGKDKDSPIRRITQYWDKDGLLLAENDPFTENKYAKKDMINFAMECINNLKTIDNVVEFFENLYS